MPGPGDIALSQAVSRFGSTLMQTADSVYRIDAQRKATSAQLSIAQDIEQFNLGLLSDPNFGEVDIDPVTNRPVFKGGYAEKWAAKQKEIADGIANLGNPLAKQEVEAFFGRTALTQSSQIANLQFKKWGAATVASTMKGLSEYIDKGIPAQAKLDYAAQQLAFLRNNNLISPEDHDSQLELNSQIILRKDLSAIGEGAYRVGGLAAAEKAILADSSTWSTGGQTFTAGDKVKTAARQDMILKDSIVRAEANSAMQDAFWNIYKPGVNPNAPKLTLAMIQGFKTNDGYDAPADVKDDWSRRLLSVANGDATGSGSLEDRQAALVINLIEGFAGSLKATIGTTQAGSATFPMNDPKTGKLDNVPMTKDALMAYVMKTPWVVQTLSSSPGSWAKVNSILASIDKPQNAGDYVLRTIVEPAVKGKPGATQAIEEAKQLFKSNAEASPQQLEDMVKKHVLGKPYTLMLKEAVGVDQLAGKVDDVDTFFGATWRGDFKDIINTIDGKPTVPYSHYKDSLQRNWAQFQIGFERVIGPTTLSSDAVGHVWLSPKNMNALPLPDKNGLKPVSVAYTLAPLAEGNGENIVAYRDINYGNSNHRRQMEIDMGGGKFEWIDVNEDGPRFKMSPADTTRILKLRENKKTADQAVLTTAQRYGAFVAASRSTITQAQWEALGSPDFWSFYWSFKRPW